jgi:hypothetical protein
METTSQRLQNQRLAGNPLKKPEEVVQWMCAVQAQDYAGAKWAIAQRAENATSAAIDKLLAEGVILRTHVMRPTWHFVMPADIRWMLKLTAPRVKALMAYQNRQQELSEADFRRANKLFTRVLQGGKQLTRIELAQALKQGGIEASGVRLACLLMRAELDAVICSGGRRDKQFTYALFDERVPPTKSWTREESLAELTRRYFTSHGPATARDFAKWSGLPVGDVKAIVEDQEIIRVKSPTVHLLPTFDEYLFGTKDHAAPSIILNGRVIGQWRRTLPQKEAMIESNLSVRIGKAEQAALKAAAKRYSRCLEIPVVIDC